jgi:hypothetical protein
MTTALLARPKAPKAPPWGYASWDAFEDDVLAAMEEVKGFGVDREAVPVVLGAAVAGLHPCPRVRAAVAARLAQHDGDEFRRQLDIMEQLRCSP